MANQLRRTVRIAAAGFAARRTSASPSPSRGNPIASAIGRAGWQGVLAGLAGAAAVSVTERVEQRVTRRPDSFAPAVTLGRLLGISDDRSEHSVPLNLAMRVGQGALVGIWRAAMAAGGLLHKAVYAFTTGWAADCLAARSGLGAGRTRFAASRASLRRGAAAAVRSVAAVTVPRDDNGIQPYQGQ